MACNYVLNIGLVWYSGNLNTRRVWVFLMVQVCPVIKWSKFKMVGPKRWSFGAKFVNGTSIQVMALKPVRKFQINQTINFRTGAMKLRSQNLHTTIDPGGFFDSLSTFKVFFLR